MAARILLVDDEPAILLLLERLLDKKGFVVTVADGGRKALELIALGLKTDLMIIDKKMPDLDGPAVLQELAKQERTMPVILMTGSLGADALVTGLSWPHEIRCLTKPASFDDLLAAICTMLKITLP
ncbi:MAG: response regulator [Candidatus Omnitrophota bacterium]|jgi:two-component system response regulator (stage 0 sporulation protein F)|nr:response regulator [Candidatus Omnitrophota bacterium]